MPYFNCHFALLSQFTKLCPSLWKSDCDSLSTTFITRRDFSPKEKQAQQMQISRTRIFAQRHKSPGHATKLKKVTDAEMKTRDSSNLKVFI